MVSSILNKTIVLRGVGASPGIAWGKAYLLNRQDVKAPHYRLDGSSDVGREIDRLRRALADTEKDLSDIKKKLSDIEDIGPLFIDVHIMMLRDKTFVKNTEENIRKHMRNAEWALNKTLERYRGIFSRMEDDYLKARIKDIEDVVYGIQRNLLGKKRESIADIKGSVIAIARDLSPADTVQMSPDRILGFATDMGGRTSHTAIVARSMEIPAVVGLERITLEIKNNDMVIVDGTAGAVIVNPGPEMVKRYEDRRKHYLAMEEDSLKNAFKPAVTMDNYHVGIGANIEFKEEIPSAVLHGAEGIGLYRTEFLYVNKETPPSEEEHFLNYRRVLQAAEIKWATIRTFDLGGDKFLSDPKLADEMNPAMGLRAVRFCLKEVDLFKVQLRAILRASAFGTTRILFPMISGVAEIRDVKEILDEVKEELVREGVSIGPKIEIGIMVEVPSAVVMADVLAEEVDFFSIGTNDLIQYGLAIDRINERVTYLYRPLHPAVLRLIKTVVEAGHKAGITVGMCGEMAGDPLCTLILLGLKLDELSMTPLAIPRVKKIIRDTTLTESIELTERAMSFAVTEEVEDYVRDYMLRRFPDICPILNDADGSARCI